jgi:hypothetical protein
VPHARVSGVSWLGQGLLPLDAHRSQDKARQAWERQEAEDRRRRREEEARERALHEEVDAYIKRLTPAARETLEAEVLARADPEARRVYEEAAPARFRATVLPGLVRQHVARELTRGTTPAGG